MSKPVVYITIDDGPEPKFQQTVLPILQAHNCPATWFLVGRYMKVYPKAAAELVAAGQEVENHTWSHANLNKISGAQVRQEIQRTDDLIMAQTGQKTSFVRPPFGAHSKSVDSIITGMGKQTAMWTVSCGDYEQKGHPEVIIDNIAIDARPNSIILLHVVPQTAQALPELLARLEARGFRFALLKDRPAVVKQEKK
ncbi:MAG: polysaccharide deacetylase family protein [bacterium]